MALELGFVMAICLLLRPTQSLVFEVAPLFCSASEMATLDVTVVSGFVGSIVEAINAGIIGQAELMSRSQWFVWCRYSTRRPPEPVALRAGFRRREAELWKATMTHYYEA